ncbi:MAG: flagellar basal body P-ring protein FlgI, partial [Planctomycetota bacterium]
MIRPSIRLLLILLAAGFVLSGCSWNSKPEPQNVEAAVAIEPAYRGTVAEHARLVDSGYLPVTGYGIVVGLGQDGSSEVPPRLKTLLVKQLARNGLGWWRDDTETVTPMRVLRDPDTAIVRVSGKIPAGAPASTTFDVEVQAVGNQTRSLAGGILMPVELHREQPGVDVALRATKTMATAGGPVYINPFIDPEKPENLAKMRSGRIVGGGKVLEARQVNLQMIRGNEFAMAHYIQRRINERFATSLSTRIANARDASMINLTIPVEYRQNYMHFIRLIPNVPLKPDADGHAKQVAEQFVAPDANLDRLSLIWECIGAKSLPVLRRFYTHERDELAYHAARAGIRLGDTSQAAKVLGRLAAKPGPTQVPAIYELGKHRRVYSQMQVLYEQLNSEDVQAQLAAYS